MLEIDVSLLKLFAYIIITQLDEAVFYKALYGMTYKFGK